jgi:hypothetical protein
MGAAAEGSWSVLREGSGWAVFRSEHGVRREFCSFPSSQQATAYLIGQLYLSRGLSEEPAEDTSEAAPAATGEAQPIAGRRPAATEPAAFSFGASSGVAAAGLPGVAPGGAEALAVAPGGPVKATGAPTPVDAGRATPAARPVRVDEPERPAAEPAGIASTTARSDEPRSAEQDAARTEPASGPTDTQPSDARRETPAAEPTDGRELAASDATDDQPAPAEHGRLTVTRPGGAPRPAQPGDAPALSRQPVPGLQDMPTASPADVSRTAASERAAGGQPGLTRPGDPAGAEPVDRPRSAEPGEAMPTFGQPTPVRPGPHTVIDSAESTPRPDQATDAAMTAARTVPGSRGAEPSSVGASAADGPDDAARPADESATREGAPPRGVAARPAGAEPTGTARPPAVDRDAGPEGTATPGATGSEGATPERAAAERAAAERTTAERATAEGAAAERAAAERATGAERAATTVAATAERRAAAERATPAEQAIATEQGTTLEPDAQAEGRTPTPPLSTARPTAGVAGAAGGRAPVEAEAPAATSSGPSVAAGEEPAEAEQLAQDDAAGAAQQAGPQWKIQPLPGDPPLTLYRDKRIVVLPAGAEVDRYGEATGNVTYAARTEYKHRSLPAEWSDFPYHAYRLQRPLEALTGLAVPWFEQPGGGTAFVLPLSITELVEDGALAEIEGAAAPD